MVKIRYILFTFLLIPFLGCKSVYLDMSNVHCNLDKSTFQKNENITIYYDGSFEDSSDIGSLRIDFHVYKMNGKERGDIQILNYPDSDIPSSYDEGLYYVIIKNNEEMTSFKNSITFFISDAGKYELVIHIDGATRKHYYPSGQTFTFPITVTE